MGGMKAILLFAGLLLLGASSFFAIAADEKAAEEGKGPLYHVVSIKFKADATKEQIREVEEAFAGLKEKIPQIKSVTWGRNVSPEKHDKGFTHCFIFTYASEKDRDEYLVHPEHEAFVKIIGPLMEDVFVLDFWSDAPPQ